ncbi:MAG: hypothetical protein U9Q98_02635 [Bacteroidota bacterium]|nr:hypothetical protein [Bacteroidota bacterium]
MKNKNILLVLIAAITATLLFSGCNKDEEEDDDQNNQETFTSLESPYLICASRNPGGVGFDFEYHGEPGGANNMDSLSVEDFNEDIVIRTIKAEKPDGTLGGRPFVKLADDVQAINYSEVDTTCKGESGFEQLTSLNTSSLNFSGDDNSFDLGGLETGTTGKPLWSEVNSEYAKLVIGDGWKEAANNDTSGDELIYIIKTSENRYIKFMVTDFPADPAPTSTGYIAIDWDHVD